MGTTIEGIGWVNGHWRGRHSALHLADRAVSRALADCDTQVRDVDLLVNCGLYRDRNLGEPALAALIQEDVGMNPEDPHEGGHGTFSFDVANGTCGPLTALQVVDRFARAGTIRSAVVVASDADPGHGLAPSFPFAPVGGALLCRWTDGDHGLRDVVWLSTDDEESFRSLVGQESGRNLLWVHRDEAYGTRAGALAAKAAVECLARAEVRAHDLEAVVVAPADHSFVEHFCDLSGCDSRVVTAADPSVHTASFILALDKARRQRRVLPGSMVLFVSAAAGITAGAALYRA